MHLAQQHGLWTARLAGISAVLCTEKHFSQPKRRENSKRERIPFHSQKALYMSPQEDSLPGDPPGVWEAGTLLQPGKSRSLVRECAECSCEWSSRQAASQGAAVIDVHSVCFVPRSVIFLREIPQSSDGHSSSAASLTSNGSCTAQLSQPHWKAQSTGTLRPLSRCGLGLADDIFRNNSSAPHRFCLCRCFSALIYCANEVVGRVVLCQMAPMSARKAGLGPPCTAQAAKGHSQRVQGGWHGAQGNCTCH